MSIHLNDNLKIQAPKLIDDRFGPHDNLSAALAFITPTLREMGLIFFVKSGINLLEYWWPTTDLSDSGVALRSYQPLDADLTSIANIVDAATGFLKKTAPNTWSLDTTVATVSTVGGGSTNFIPRFASAFGLINSAISDDGSLVLIDRNTRINGRVGLGENVVIGTNIQSSMPLTGSDVVASFRNSGITQNDVTTSSSGFLNDSATAANTTITTLIGFHSRQGTIGAGSSITNQYAFYADASLTGAGRNLGFFGLIPNGPLNFNAYMAGTAPNYFAGNTLIGNVINDGANILQVTGNQRITGRLGIGLNPSFGIDLSGSGVDGILNTLRTSVNGVGAASAAAFGSDARTAADGLLVNFNMQNSSLANVAYGRILTTILSPTASAHSSRVTIQPTSAGAFANGISIWNDGALTVNQLTNNGIDRLQVNGSGLFQTTLRVGAGIVTTIPDGAGDTFTPNIFSTTTSGVSAIAVHVNDGTNNRRAGLFVDNTNNVWGLSATQSASSIPFVIRLNAAERLRMNVDGNMGLAVIPSAWDASYRALQIGSSGALWSSTGSTGDVYLSSNVFFNPGGTLNYINSNFASDYYQLNGAHIWRSAISGTAGGTLSFSTLMTLNASGSLGIGSTSLSQFGLRNSKNLTGNTTYYSYYADGRAQSDVTNSAIGYFSIIGTAAASFSLGELTHFKADQGVFGAGSSVNSQFGFRVDNSVIGAINNYGFFSGIAAGANRWGFYNSGTANNYFNGRTLFGTTVDNGVDRLQVSGSSFFGGNVRTTGGVYIGSSTLDATVTSLTVDRDITGSTVFQTIRTRGEVKSDVTSSVVGFATSISTQTASFNLADLTHYRASQGAIGLGSSVTTQSGFLANSNLIGATNNYGFWGIIPSGVGRYNLFMQGTAANYLEGTTLIGTLADDGVSKLIVNGTVSGIFRSGQNYRISGTAGGWDRRYGFFGSGGTDRGGFGALGGTDALTKFYIGNTNSDNIAEFDTATKRTSLQGNVSATIPALGTAGTTFLTHTSGLIQSRTASQVLADIGAQAALTNPTTGTGVAGQITFWNGTTTLTGNNNLFWDNSNLRLSVGAYTTATIHDGAGVSFVPRIFSTNTTGVAGIGVAVIDGTNNRRAGLFVDNTNNAWGIGYTYTSGATIPFIISAAGVERLRLTHAGDLLLGTTLNDGNDKLQVNGSVNIFSSNPLRFRGGTAWPTLRRNTSTGGLVIDSEGTAISGALLSIRTLTTDLVTVTSSGNFLIGTAVDSGFRLNIQGTQAGGNIEMRLANITADATGARTRFNMPVFNGTNGFVIDNTINSIDGYGTHMYHAQPSGILSFGGPNRANAFFTIAPSGNVGIGSTTLFEYGLRINRNLSGAITSYNTSIEGTVLSSVTAGAYYLRTEAATQAATFTLTSLIHYGARQGVFGAGSIVTNQFGFFAESSITSAVNNYGFYGNIAAGTGRWNAFMAGTANNHFNGRTLFGTTTDNGVDRLQINGTSIMTGLTVTNGDVLFNTSEKAVKWLSNGVIEWGATASLFFRPNGFVPNSLILNQSGGALFGGAVTLTSLAGSGNRITFTNASGLLGSMVIGSGLSFDGTTLTASGGGGGTVTSVAASVPGFLSISGSPITSSGTLAITYSGTALPIANGGTGSTTQNFVDLSTTQAGIGGNKTFTGNLSTLGTLSVIGAATFSNNVSAPSYTNSSLGYAFGISNEVTSSAVNFGINDGTSNRFGGTYTSSRQGGMIRFDTRSGQSLFTLFGRAAGVSGDVASLLSISSGGTATFNSGEISAYWTSSATSIYHTYITGVTERGYIGSGASLFTSGAVTDFGIGVPGGGSIKFAIGSTPRLTIAADGSATFSSTVTATLFTQSDRTMKTSIKADYLIKGIENIRAHLYRKNGVEEIGYYAQDAQPYIPSAVRVGQDGKLVLSYTEVLVAKVASLEARVKELESRLNHN